MAKTRNPVPLSRLKAARERAGLSLDALAERSGVSRATIWNAEKTPSRLTRKTAAAVAPFLSVEPKELLKMSLPVIDITDAVRRTTMPADLKPKASTRVIASVGVLGGLVDPEDPKWQGDFVHALLASPRHPLRRGDESAYLVRSAKGREFVMVEGRDEDGGGILAFVHELEWRLAQGELEFSIFAGAPEVIQ